MYRSLTLVAAGLLPFATATLNKLAVAKGLDYFGTATDNGELTDSAYVAILDDETEFGQITPGNTMKWVYTEPTQGVFNYTQGDVIMDLAEANGQLLRCHNLVWYNELPSWVTSGTWTNATLIAALQNHITNEVTHYKGKCYAWDVVNEALNDDGTYRSDVFYDTIGEAYIPIAFAAAAAADPDVKLYYNDYNIEYPGTKSTAAQAIVSSLINQGIKIDGVGFQGHFIVGSTPSTSSQVSNLEAYTALGVEVAYTEVDIRFSSLPPSDSGLQQQATDYVSTVNACLQVDGCVGITVWDFDDKYSWIPSTFSGQGEACLYNSDLSKKPAWTSVSSALGGAATGSATTTSSAAVTTTTSGSSSSSTGVAKYGQCGGLTYTGSTTCASGSTCTYQNAYYSQCL